MAPRWRPRCLLDVIPDVIPDQKCLNMVNETKNMLHVLSSSGVLMVLCVIPQTARAQGVSYFSFITKSAFPDLASYLGKETNPRK